MLSARFRSVGLPPTGLFFVTDRHPKIAPFAASHLQYLLVMVFSMATRFRPAGWYFVFAPKTVPSHFCE
ncbi:MAG: hypothetical protein CMQ46_00385 [Gammaproteobacteria bacterium]|nr:hypothetical protein [Gammaproteobacteria bacterium]HBN14937.1 hypothetical protein [Pseudohongiella sp.]